MRIQVQGAYDMCLMFYVLDQSLLSQSCSNMVQFRDHEPVMHASGAGPYRKGYPGIAVAAAAERKAQVAAALRQ